MIGRICSFLAFPTFSWYEMLAVALVGNLIWVFGWWAMLLCIPLSLLYAVICIAAEE